ncbi:isoprenoid synthase domain-containing protein [Hysterangium stoloniferum]|nr:isoprenoid synthase domain-containing protein [Hysterangium stoloniferum]
MSARVLTQSSFLLPQISCPFPASYHPNGDIIAAASDKWFEAESYYFTEARRRRLHQLKVGRLVAYCYHRATDDNRLRIVCDYMNVLFHMDDLCDFLSTSEAATLSEVTMNALASPHVYRTILPSGRKLPVVEPEASKLIRNFWRRCIVNMTSSVQTRFCENISLAVKTIETERKFRGKDSLPDIAAYIAFRRENSACRAAFDLLEYCLEIELPNFVRNDPSLTVLSNCAIDFIALSNDIYSYNVEQSRGDICHSVPIIMKIHNSDLQEAVDRIADMCRESVESFQAAKALLPSWGTEIDKDVAMYIGGIEDWMSGNIQWSLFLERYFPPGSKKDGVVTLLSRQTDVYT